MQYENTRPNARKYCGLHLHCVNIRYFDRCDAVFLFLFLGLLESPETQVKHTHTALELVYFPQLANDRSVNLLDSSGRLYVLSVAMKFNFRCVL